MLRITSESRASDAAFRALADAAAAAVGLHLALARPAVAAEVAATLTDGAQVVTEVRIPDVLAAIAIRTFAYAERFAARDAEDLYLLGMALGRAGKSRPHRHHPGQRLRRPIQVSWAFSANRFNRPAHTSAQAPTPPARSFSTFGRRALLVLL